MLQDLLDHLRAGDPILGTTPEQLLQGPFSDAMTHAGQLATLRRLSGSPVPPENFIVADIGPSNLGTDQPAPESPTRVARGSRCRMMRQEKRDRSALRSTP